MEDESIETRIQQAMRSRVQHFRDQADSLTFEGVRRLLEKDMVLDTYALDAHKRYVKQLLEKYLSATEDDENVSKNSEQIKSEKVKKVEDEEQNEHKITEIRSENEAKIEDSPIMGLLSGAESAKSENLETQSNAKDNIPTEDMIKDALWKKAAYFRSKSEELTMAGVRRLLERDLELEKFSLDSFKKLISKQLDEVLNSETDTPHKKGSKSDSESEDMEVEVKPKKKVAPKGKIQKFEGAKKRKSSKLEGDSLRSESDDSEVEVKPKKKVAPEGKVQKSEGAKKRKNSKLEGDSLHSGSDDSEVQVKLKKKLATKGKSQKSEGAKKRKRSAQETERAKKKQIKNAKETSVEKNNVEDADDYSSAEKSESSAEKSVKKEVAAPAYGKKVERLKSIIKACGMTVAPVVYKKAKQVPENKREAFIIKELQEVLSKEGLSANPSEKEIKEVKRRKERAKELEGIDTGNIVSGSRRRSTSFFKAPTPSVQVAIESDSDDSEDNENDDGDESANTDDEDGGDSANADNDDGEDEVEDDRQSEEVHEANTDNDDGRDQIKDDVHGGQREEIHDANTDNDDGEDQVKDDNVHGGQNEEAHEDTD